MPESHNRCEKQVTPVPTSALEEKIKKRKVNDEMEQQLVLLEQTITSFVENNNFDKAVDVLLTFINFSEHASIDQYPRLVKCFDMIYKASWPTFHFSKVARKLENQFTFTTIHNEHCNKLILASMYSGAWGHAIIYDKAINILLNSDALKSHYIAQNLLGDIYYAQEYFEEAKKYYEFAAKQNYACAQVNLGFVHFGSSNASHAIYYYEMAARQNYNDAFYHLGKIYESGRGMDNQDFPTAIQYYEKAAEHNHAPAMFVLGNIYEKGKRVQKDINKALEYYERSAQLGDEQAQYYMGRLYEKGLYVPQDFGKSMKYFELAAQQQCYTAFRKLGKIYRDGCFGNVAQNLTKAIYYFELYDDECIEAKDLRIDRFFQEFQTKALRSGRELSDVYITCVD
ncbi:hypothetical protein C9374_008008 [Naegleria lovaniensis]|uniref:Uncharacterized protein n=1 Tax=Naegleria lovaniensis TaxID=51637 RepID=A0AA88GLA6_NAELO|nr:uncharacterized protein C9374_008008 [Naegleria lovaniensis]KAG2378860.1 hypothetical protein C9374_008008 [Naegleria lovaniensis]